MERQCVGHMGSLLEVTKASKRSLLKASTYRTALMNVLYSRMLWAVPTTSIFLGRRPHVVVPAQRQGGEPLDLKPGDWVEVKTADEIQELLDSAGRTKGLFFMPEMWDFCGKRFKIYKKVEKITIEATGEHRNLKNPTYLLEGVYCDGHLHGGCDRSCFLFWKDDWLRRSSSR